MKSLFYRMDSRRKYLLKSILIICLVSLSSILFLLVPQLINPLILRKYLNNYDDGIINFEVMGDNITNYPLYDFTFTGKANSLDHLENFDSILSDSSLKAFNLFEPKSFTHYAEIGVFVNSTKYAKLLCISNSLFQNLLNLSDNSSTGQNSVIMLKFNQSDILTTGIHTIDIADQDADLLVTNEIPLDVFQSTYPFFSGYFSDGYFQSEINLQYVYFLKKEDYTTLWNSKIGSSVPFEMNGFVVFSENQKGTIYWSVKSVEMITTFINDLETALPTEGSSIKIYVSQDALSYAENNQFLVEFLHSFIRSIQLLIWSLSFIVIVFTINKIQKINKEQEIKIILAGQSWKLRIFTHLFESFIITLSSLAIALAVLYPLILLQHLFGISIILDKSIFIGLGVIAIVQLLTIFGVYVDYEFYLRRVATSNLSLSEEYKPLMFVPIYGKIIGGLMVIALLWVLNRNYNLLYLAGLYLASLIISAIIVLSVKLFIRLLISIADKRAKKRDKEVSTTFILFKLWRKFISSKFLIYSFVLSLMLSTFLVSTLASDAIKNTNNWWIGGEINFDSPVTNISEVNQVLDSNSAVIDYTTCIKKWTNISLLEVSLGEENPNYYGIDKSDYFDYFRSWNTKKWLVEGDLNNFNENTIFLTQKFRDFGFKLGDIIDTIDNTHLIIGGFIGSWPSITDPMGELSQSSLEVVIDFNTLQAILEGENIEYCIDYIIHTKEQQIESIIESLSNLTYLEEINIIDSMIYEGIKRVLLFPIVLVFEMLIIFWSALFAYSNIEDINTSLEAKSLGIVAINKNFKKPLIFVKIIESIIHMMILTLTIVLIFVIAYNLIAVLLDIYFVLSKQTYVFLVIIFTAYLLVQILQVTFEYLNYKRLNLSLLYRHPE